MSLSSQSTKLRIKTNKYSKSKIESKLQELYPDSLLSTQELNYDLDLPKDCKVNINYTLYKPNIDKIKKLPSSSVVKIFENKYDEDEVEDSNKDVTEPVPTTVEEDIDLDSLEKETIGNKSYYMDYSKGIIYDMSYNVIGNIDEYGEINIF